jgi:hypothetical protein
MKYELKELEDGSHALTRYGETVRPATNSEIEFWSTLREVEMQRDVAVTHIAEWCAAIDKNGSDWDSWDDYYKDACYRKSELLEIRRILDEAIEKAKKESI